MKIQKVKCITETDNKIDIIEFNPNGLMYIYWSDGKTSKYSYKNYYSLKSEEV